MQSYRWLKLGQILLSGFGPLQPAVIRILIITGQHIPEPVSSRPALDLWEMDTEAMKWLKLKPLNR